MLDLALSLDSESADQRAKAMIFEKAKLVSPPLPKKMAPKFRYKIRSQVILSMKRPNWLK